MTTGIPDLIKGRVAWIFGDDFDVDLIIGVENIKYYDPELLASVCMKSFESDFLDHVQSGDVVVAGRNFGYGHPHYPAMISMRNAGIVAVLAESFAPGFWRGEIYQGMPLITVPGISTSVSRWDRLSIDWRKALVSNESTGASLTGNPLSDHAINVISAGGGYRLLLERFGSKGASAAPTNSP